MEIKNVSNKYSESIKHICTYCFQIPPGYAEFFEKNIFSSENCLGCFDGDKLAGLLYIHPYDMFFWRKSVPMGGIGLVSTLPEYRHRHCASNLLVKSVEIMKDRGYIFSALGPFSYAFYRKYGWELAFNAKKYSIPIDELKGLGVGNGVFHPLTLNDIDAMARVYERHYSRYNGAINRDKKNWEIKIKELERNQAYGYGCSRQVNGLDGYILYSIKEGTFNIEEIAYDSLETKLELLRFVYYHSAQVNKVSWRAPIDDNTVLLLDNPRIEQKIEAGMMIRVIDVKKALEAYVYPLVYKGSFTIKVEDEYAPWNNGIFKVSIGEGTAMVEDLVNSPNNDILIDIECNIQTFSQIVLGYIGLKEAVELGQIAAHNCALLDDLEVIFKKRATHMTDAF